MNPSNKIVNGELKSPKKSHEFELIEMGGDRQCASSSSCRK